MWRPALFRASSALVLALALVAAPALATWPQDDAGSGGDAPDEAALALALTPGTYNTSLSRVAPWNDTEDWYEMPVPAHHALLVDVIEVWPSPQDPFPFTPCVGTFRTDGTRLATNGCEPRYPVPGPTPIGETVRLRIHGAPLWMNATFTVSTTPVPDLSLTIAPASEGPLALDRWVALSVANEGLVATPFELSLTAGRPGSALADSCVLEGPEVAPGGLWQATARLPGSAHLGDVHVTAWIEATAAPHGESELQDNLAFLWSQGPVDRTGGTLPGAGGPCAA